MCQIVTPLCTDRTVWRKCQQSSRLRTAATRIGCSYSWVTRHPAQLQRRQVRKTPNNQLVRRYGCYRGDSGSSSESAPLYFPSCTPSAALSWLGVSRIEVLVMKSVGPHPQWWSRRGDQGLLVEREVPSSLTATWARPSNCRCRR